MNQNPPRVVLDCDTANEIDDQFAIAHALGLPPGTFDVRGIVSVHNTTAHGPASRDIYQEEAERVVALCGERVPCIPGAEHPMETREDPVGSSGTRLPGGRSPARPADRTRHRPGDGCSLALTHSARGAREPASGLARWFRERGDLRKVGVPDGRAERPCGHRRLADALRDRRKLAARTRLARARESHGWRQGRSRRSYVLSVGPSPTTWLRYCSRGSMRMEEKRAPSRRSSGTCRAWRPSQTRRP